MRIVRDAAHKMGIDIQSVFYAAVAMHGGKENPEQLFGYYQRTNTIPSWMVDYLVDVITEKPNAVDHCPGNNCSSCRHWLSRRQVPKTTGEAAA